MIREEMERLVAYTDNKSEKIRILFREGVQRAEIARFLGITYQHVQNVLKRSGLLAKPQAQQDMSSRHDKIYTVTVMRGGMVALPAEYVENEEIAEGDVLICRAGNEGLLIMSRDAAAQTLRETLRQQMPAEAALLEALLDRPRSS